jgi:hypothetical protein
VDWGEVLTPLNPIHFNPTSLINSAVASASYSGEAAWNNSASESGEFIVMVVAVCYSDVNVSYTSLHERH